MDSPIAAPRRGRRRRAGRAALPFVLMLASALGPVPSRALAPNDAVPPVESVAVAAQDGPTPTAYEGVVEAVRQSVLAAQVAGAVVALHVRAGDRVQAGQVLLRVDARAADPTAVAGAAQATAARAALEVATQDVERQRQLAAQGFISAAAFDRAQAGFKSAQAQAAAQGALAVAATAQSGFHVVRAPYDGVVAAVAVVQGDMALPGRPLLTLYDPTALRISAPIPQTVAAKLAAGVAARAEVPGAHPGLLQPVRVQWLPTVDAASHTLELRLDLPAGTGAAPGMFARAWLPVPAGTGETRLFVPARSLVRRAEFAAVYVLDRNGRPMLRQVRPGRSDGSRVEVLAGVAAGERVALDPQSAARLR